LGRAAMDAATNWGHFYIQDNWQLTPNLKVDVGLRYEYNQNMTDANNQIAAIDTSVPGGRFVVASGSSGNISPAANTLLPFLPIPYVTSSAAGWNNSLLVPRSLRLAPRAGLAWSIPGFKTVVRAGFGIYPNQAAYSIVTNLAQNLPFFVTKTVSSTAAALSPSFTTENGLHREYGRNGRRQQPRPQFQDRIQRSMELQFGTRAEFQRGAFFGVHRLAHCACR
jgi:TonB dependent receptor